MEIEFNGVKICGVITCRMLREAERSVGFGIQQYDQRSIEDQFAWQAAVIGAFLRRHGQEVTDEQIQDWGLKELRAAGQAVLEDLVGELEAPVGDEPAAAGDPFSSGQDSSA